MQKEEPNTYIWRQFDESFRKMREGCKGDPLPWHIHHPQCISNANRLITDLFPSSILIPTLAVVVILGVEEAKVGEGGVFRVKTEEGSQICDKYNDGSCTFQKCKYTHLCANCRGVHSATHCKYGPTPKPQASATIKKKMTL